MFALKTQSLLELPLWATAALPILIALSYIIGKGVYNIYFHPLSNIPGPKLWAFNEYVYTWYWVRGRYPFYSTALHNKYGPVVRVSPDQVSFNSASSWKQIYGNIGGRKGFLKAHRFYTVEPHLPPHLVGVVDPKEHGKMRKPYASSFSAKSLREQEPLVQEYVDLLVKQLGNEENSKRETDMTKWYNWCTFDIIGDLAYGDSFGCLREAKPHLWVKVVFDFVLAQMWMQVVVRHFGFNWLMTKLSHMFVVPQTSMENRQAHYDYSMDKIKSRLQKPVDARKDFFSNVLTEEEGKSLSIDELNVQSSLLIIAGSETTATFLCGITYFLLRNPRAYKKLITEIREECSSYEDISNANIENLPYLGAAIQEGLRMYPPVPVGMPRVSPGETIDGIYIPEGFEVFTDSFAASHSEFNFHRPFEFIPERWIDKDCMDKKEASQPFSLGTRICLGRNLALLEMRLILAKLMWVYDMELLDDDVDYYRDSKAAILWQKPSLHVKFTRRGGIRVPPIDG